MPQTFYSYKPGTGLPSQQFEIKPHQYQSSMQRQPSRISALQNPEDLEGRVFQKLQQIQQHDIRQGSRLED